MKHLSDRFLVVLAVLFLLVGSQFLTWTRISPIVASVSSNNDDSALSWQRELNVAQEKGVQSSPTADSSAVIRAETQTTVNAQPPAMRPSKPPSKSAFGLPTDDDSFKESSPSASPMESNPATIDYSYPSQLSSIPRDAPAETEGSPSLSETDNLSLPNSDTSTSDIFTGEKVRTFSFPRANLNSTYLHGSVQQTLPLENKVPKHCVSWGVVTTNSDPTQAIIRMSNLPRWCLVVVADTKTPSNFMEQFSNLGGHVESTVFFSVELQTKWEYLDGPIGTFAKALPWNQLGRKNMGYLFAILHGAEYVFDFDEFNQIKLVRGKPWNILPLNIKKLENVTTVMVGPTAFNPYPVMMMEKNSSQTIPNVKMTWPRGFPLELVQNNATKGQVAFHQKFTRMVSRLNLIGVIQFVANVQPDFDELNIISRPGSRFRNSFHVLVPKHSYSPYNAQATIHTQSALWATLLPISVSDAVSDIWRSYFAQCIFADSNIRVVFAPPKVDRILPMKSSRLFANHTKEEGNLYQKRSRQLIDFLSQWDSDYLTIPERVEQLWMDLYERAYIELEDVQLLQKWLEVLAGVNYPFPKVQPRFRNVAVMGQFNYADFPNIMEQTIFWTQKMRERFQTVVAAGPFNSSQMALLKSLDIPAIASEPEFLETDEKREVDGFYSPLSNLMRALLEYRNSSKIQAVLYVHDDALLNTTELSLGQYPFPTDQIIASRRRVTQRGDGLAYLNLRNNRSLAKLYAHRVYPNNGTVCNGDKALCVKRPWNLKVMPSFDDHWEHWNTPYCAKGQVKMAMDPEFAQYLEPDGMAWFPMHTQSDFLLVPTTYADEFAKIGQLHLKHKIWIECAFGKVVDVLEQQMNARVRVVQLCTLFKAHRGKWKMLTGCLKREETKKIAVFHPFKMFDDLGTYSEKADALHYPGGIEW